LERNGKKERKTSVEEVPPGVKPSEGPGQLLRGVKSKWALSKNTKKEEVS